MAEDTVVIRKLRIDCAAVGQTAIRNAKPVLERVVQTHLPDLIARYLNTSLPADWRGSEVSVYIPKLVIDLDIDLDADPQQIARAWAKFITLSLAQADEGKGLAHFPDAATHLAAFLRDLVQGIAWRKPQWYDYAGVKALPLPRALATIMLRDTALTIKAVAQLSKRQQDQLVTALGHSGAQTIVRAVFGDAHKMPSSDQLTIIAQQAVTWVSKTSVMHRRSAAQLCLTRLFETPLQPPAWSTLGSAGIVYIVEQALKAHHARSPVAHEADATEQTMGQDLPPNDKIAIKTAIAEATATQAKVQPQFGANDTAEQTKIWTPYGGMFLLLPHIMALCPDLDIAAICAICSRALGVHRDALFTDPAIAEVLTGHAGDQRVSAAISRVALRAWADAEGCTTTLWTPLPEAAIYVLRCVPQGYWLDVRTTPRGAVFEPTRTDAAIDGLDWHSLSADYKDRHVAQAAQIVLRRFAYRIPGFAASSANYLRENFLCMDAYLDRNDKGLVVALGTPPIGIMLNMSGVSRQSYTLPNRKTLRLSMLEGGR